MMNRDVVLGVCNLCEMDNFFYIAACGKVRDGLTLTA